MYRSFINNYGKFVLGALLIYIFVLVNRDTSVVVQVQPIESTQSTVINRLRIIPVPITASHNPSKIHSNIKHFCVFNPNCKIPRVDPFSADVMGFFKPPKFKECTNQPDLIKVYYDKKKRQYRLNINESLIMEMFPNISKYGCEYSEIIRGANDSIVGQYKPVYFEQNWLVPRHFLGVIVNCHELGNKSHVLQRDAFSFVQYPPNRKDEKDAERSRTYPTIIMLGIDAMSQFNFQRTMPLTAQFVHQPGWYEMLGYNKIGDNTLPNILTLLTGATPEQWDPYCDVRRPGCLDSYTYLWNHYHNAGYLTAYAEDLSSIDTFHYLLYGFIRQPVDYYLHPFIQGIEHILDKVKHFGYDYCLGRRQSYRYVFDFCLQLLERFVNETQKPLFGLFWTNSFSHDDFSGPASVDKDFLSYLIRFQRLGLFEKAIVIVLSDHGQRHGLLMNLRSSFLEERLPMLHIYLPPWYRQQHPGVAAALDRNRHQLSTPYDLHLTLKHILQMSRPCLDYSRSLHALNAQSLLLPLPENRSCVEADIPEHWCTCDPYTHIPLRNPLQHLAKLIVYRMNQYLIRRNYDKRCHRLRLSQLLMVERKQFFDVNGNEVLSPNEMESYRFKFTTFPNDGLFRASILSSRNSNFVEIREEYITRLNSYRNDSYCVNERTAKSFCVCLKNIRLEPVWKK